jgi:hypothetical protein
MRHLSGFGRPYLNVSAAFFDDFSRDREAHRAVRVGLVVYQQQFPAPEVLAAFHFRSCSQVGEHRFRMKLRTFPRHSRSRPGKIGTQPALGEENFYGNPGPQATLFKDPRGRLTTQRAKRKATLRYYVNASAPSRECCRASNNFWRVRRQSKNQAKSKASRVCSNTSAVEARPPGLLSGVSQPTSKSDKQI